MPMHEHGRSPLLKYGCAVVSILLMTWPRLSLLAGQRQRFVTFDFAIIFTARYGGLGPSVLGIVLACLASAFFLLMPYHSLQIADRTHLLGMGMFVAVCSAIV